MIRTVFMGTPMFAVPSLEALIEHPLFDVVGVVTQPDRPAGRKNELTPPPIKLLARANAIPVLQPEKLRAKESVESLREWQPELIVVAAFGQILPKSVLDMPKHACINVHGSLLPRWRGAAPIHAAIRAGDFETGITIMLMDEGLDTGAMLSKRAVHIDLNDTTASLHDTLSQIGAELLIDTLPDYINGEITPEVQDETWVTYAPQIQKEDGRINWKQSAVEIERTVRAFSPWPSTFTTWEGKTLKILEGAVGNGRLSAGRVGWASGLLSIGTGEGVFHPIVLQLEGKKRLGIAEFVNGYPTFINAHLG